MIDYSVIPNAPVVVIVGPTAIGKSDLSVNLARERGCEIASADAFQVYRKMDVGTAKVSAAILKEIPHYLVDIRDPDESYSVGEFLAEVEPLIHRAHNGGPRLIICGGTGLYIHSMLHRYQTPNIEVDPALRESLNDDLYLLGSRVLWERLAAIDADAAQEIHPHHSSRIVRALELTLTTGRPISTLRSAAPTQRLDCVIVGLRANRETVWDRILQRADAMIQHGLIDEVSGLLAQGYSPDLPAFQALGYKETVAYLNGTLPTTDALKTAIFHHTRQFAKRQMTWFKRIQNVHWTEVG